MLERLSWFWHRYQSMHRGEVAFRIHEWQTKRRDQAGFECPPVSEKLLEQPLPQLGLLNQESISDTVWQQLEADVSSILREEWSLLGVQRPAGSRCAWGVDPSSGKQWPMDQSGMSIDYRHDYQGLDIKLAWEHLKLQHLQVVAAAASRDPAKPL